MKNQPYQQKLRASVLGILILLIVSCSQKKTIDVQGHRGCRGLMPENSLPAFQKAMDLGVTTLELDIAITKNNEVVVSHEPYMSRVICNDSSGNAIPEIMDKKYNLYNMTHEEIKSFDCGSKFHLGYPKQEKLKVYKPLLKEVFDLTKKNNSEVKFNIEIKSKPKYYGVYTPEPETYVRLVVETIKDNDMLEHSNLQSFDLNILEEIKKQSPNIPVALLVDGNEDIDEKLSQLSYSPEIISPYYGLLTQSNVTKLKNQGFLVIPWTINNVSDMEELMSWQVDGIITDYPDLLLNLLK